MDSLIDFIRDSESTSDKIKLIWIASAGPNKNSSSGVASVEKPKPVLV